MLVYYTEKYRELRAKISFFFSFVTHLRMIPFNIVF